VDPITFFSSSCYLESFSVKKGQDLEIIINSNLVSRIRMCECSLNFPVRINGMINKRKEIFTLL